MRIRCDYLVIGSGISGLTFALEASRNADVIVTTKRGLSDTATNFAQGGIAAVLDPVDSFEQHAQDTLTAGRGLSDPEVVQAVVRDGPGRIQELIELGADFSRAATADAAGAGDAAPALDLTKEGGHSARRVVHAADITGREVQRVLGAAAAAAPRIRILEDHMTIDLIEGSTGDDPRGVRGAYVLDHRAGEVHTVEARATVLACGGAGKVYLYTSNPDVATGDGVAMAYRAGAEIANMEFFQFHPTCLYHPQAKSFLISEALRGEGGVLLGADRKPFMQHHHAQKDLAPRDVVARAIDFELKRSGADHVFLDMGACTAEYIERRFPNIHAECMRYGIDMRREPIPVVPAAHYMCGGVMVDMEGRTSLPGLWAIGETTCTGLHGANRLASNSLLEGLVYGRRAAHSVAQRATDHVAGEPPEWDIGEAAQSDEAVIVAHNWDELRRCMSNYVGIARSDRRLQRAARRISLLQEEIRDYYWKNLVTLDLLELRNIADVAELIVACARFRKESRGLHYTTDYPEVADGDYGGDTVLSRDAPPALR